VKVAHLSIVVLGALSSTARAQPAPIDLASDAFDKNLEAHEDRIQQHYLPVWTTEVDVAISATPELAPLGPANAATAASRLAAAVSTDVEGAEAGVTFSPAKLAGDVYSALAGINITIASLEHGGARGGVGWAHAWNPKLELSELELPRCDATPAIEAARALRDHYVRICEGIPLVPYPTGPSTPDLAKAQRKWIGIALACGQEDRLDPVRRSERVRVAQIEGLSQEYVGGDPLYLRVRDLVDAATGIDALDQSRKALEKWRETPYSRTSCYNDEKTRKSVTEAVARALWQHPRMKLGISAHADMFPLQFGFNPEADHEPALPLGELEALQLHLEAEYTLGPTTLTLGASGGYSREGHTDKLGRALAPNIGLRVVLARLDHKSIRDTPPDGTTPVVAIGATARGERTLDKEDIQEGPWNEVEVKVFADFKVSEKLEFRVGVPLSAKLEPRKDDSGTEVKRGLQWSVPVFVATVLKL
jgi:hypothetical protein